MNKEIERIKRFEAGQLSKITKALDKLFSQTNNCSEDKAVQLKDCLAVDPQHVCMVVAKTEEAKRCLSLFVDTNNTPKLPPLDYIVRNGDANKKYTASYSMDYITVILNVLKHTSNYIRISLKEDYPSTLETEHFKFLLAPRLEEEW